MLNFKNAKYASKGFTLIELTIVFTIMAVIGGIGFAAYTSFSSNQKLDQAAYDLKAGIDEAKLTAISRIKPASCGATSALDGYRLNVCTGASCANLYEMTPICTPPPSTSPTPVVKVRDPKIVISQSQENCGTPSAPGNPFIFMSRIGLTTGTCEFLLLNTENENTKLVCVDAGGNVSVKSGDSEC